MEKDVFDRALEKLKLRRDRINSGLVNCIPLPFPRLRNWLPGIEKKRYTIITANQKVGKSKLADYMLVYEPFFYSIENPDKVRLKILYFTLEMGKEEKFYEFLCHLLFKLDNIRISPTELKSTSKAVDGHILELLESERYKKYIDKFKETVIYNDTDRNPTGINKTCRAFALNRGKLHIKKVPAKDEQGLPYDKEVVDYYEPNDSEETVIVIIDNYSNLLSESGMNKMQTIEKMSKYAITLRDQLEFNIVAIQHQAQSQEGIENQKLNKLYPTSDGLADCKTTTRDANLVLGLYSPFKYGLENHKRYNIKDFRNYIRFLQVIEDRDNGAGGQICPLFFDGAVSFFTELPLPDQHDKIQEYVNYIRSLERSRNQVVHMLVSSGIRKEKNKLQRLIKLITFAD